MELEFGSVGFYGVRKTGEPGEKPSEQGREPTTNSTQHNRQHNNLRGKPEHPWHFALYKFRKSL